jgi:hypothetical protein
MNSQNPVNWKLINKQIESALSSYDKVMLHIRLSADFGYTNSIFFDSSKKQEILHALVPFNSKNRSIEEACLLAINSDKAIIKSYTNAKILEVIEIHQMGEKGYSKGVIHNFRTVSFP